MSACRVPPLPGRWPSAKRIFKLERASSPRRGAAAGTVHSGRKNPRFKIDTPGMIYDPQGNPLFGCTVRDISATGAGLALNEDAPLPQSFVLAFTRDGAVRRLCE